MSAVLPLQNAQLVQDVKLTQDSHVTGILVKNQNKESQQPVEKTKNQQESIKIENTLTSVVQKNHLAAVVMEELLALMANLVDNTPVVLIAPDVHVVNICRQPEEHLAGPISVYPELHNCLIPLEFNNDLQMR